jgi:hypothetical protein
MEIFYWIVWIAVMAGLIVLNSGPKGRAKRKAATQAATAQAEVIRRELEQSGI